MTDRASGTGWRRAGEAVRRLGGDLRSEPAGPRFRWRWVLVPLITALALTFAARFSGFDLAAQAWIYEKGEGSWDLGRQHVWWFFYEFGTYPAAAVMLLSAAGYMLSWRVGVLREWRRILLFCLLLGVIGPGVITNGMLKEYWGRPRPREVLELGGHQRFEPVLSIDAESDGKSFPCGHATMGYFFFGGFFLLRRHRRRLALGFLVLGGVFGGLLSVARMMQGGHFFTDGVWAGVVCYFTAMGLYFVMGLDRGFLRAPAEKRPPLLVQATVGLLAAGVLAGVLLAAPYQDRRNWFLIREHSQSGPLELRMIFEIGEIEFVASDSLLISGEAWGHGVPTSRVADNFLEIRRKDHTLIHYHEQVRGWFTEVEESLRVEVPWRRVRQMSLATGEANVSIEWPDEGGPGRILLRSGEGTVTVRSGGEDGVVVVPRGAERVEGQPVAISPEEARRANRWVLELGDDFAGRVLIDP